jgi:hypothetical protein
MNAAVFYYAVIVGPSAAKYPEGFLLEDIARSQLRIRHQM